MLIVIVNYKNTENALKLRRGLSVYAPVHLVDSGSGLANEESKEFDICLPNVYYNGLINHAAEQAADLAEDDAVVFICSDVTVDDYGHFVSCVNSAFDDDKVGVYAPASKGSGHPQMWPTSTAMIRKVSFAEGFCFAARKSIFAQACPIDLTINRLGWGVDVYFSYLAICNGKVSVVDDRSVVHHPKSTGYNTGEAALQRNRWFDGFSISARFYRFFATLPGFRCGIGCGILYRLTSLLVLRY